MLSTKSQQRRVLRNINTMRCMLAQHQQKDQCPSLQAVTTLYLSLLEGNADSSVWALFTQVASLPLVTTVFKPQCVLTGYHGLKGVWIEGACQNAPHCGHKNVPVSTTVTLTSVDSYMLERGVAAHSQGTTLHAQDVSQWWTAAITQALGVNHA